MIEELATKVMGWEIRESDCCGDYYVEKGSNLAKGDVVDWNPLEDWNDTMMVVEKTKPRPFLFEYNDATDKYIMEFGELEKGRFGRCYPHPNPCIAKDKDPQKAICLAALKCYA